MIERTDIQPSVEDVSLLLRTRTVGTRQGQGWLGGDTGPNEVTVFDENTRPTADEVFSLVEVATDQVLTTLRAPLAALEPQAGSVRHIISLYTAVLIETSFFRNDVNQDLLSMWRSMAADAIGSINDALDTSSRPGFGTLSIGTALAADAPLEVDAIHDWPAGEVP